MLTFNEFITKYEGKALDFDGACGVQCVDLAKAYLFDCFGIKAVKWGNAHAYFDDFKKHKELTDNFTLIKNTPSFVPKKGDICVFNKSMGGTGHICIAAGIGTTAIFYSYDINFGSKKMRMVLHNYKKFAGVLRPKKQNKVLGLRKTSERLNAYEKDDYKKSALILPKGAKVEIIEQKHGSMTKNKTKYDMAKIEYNKRVYYVASKYLIEY